MEKWSIDQGNLMSVTVRIHRLGLYLKSKDKPLLRSVTQESVITNSKQVKPKKSADSFKDSNGNRNWNFVELINKVLQRWKNYGNFRVLPSILLLEENSSRMRTLFLNFLAEYRNCKNEVNCMSDSKDFQDADITSQWKFPRYQSTSVFPTSSNTWRNAKPFFWSAEPQRRAAKHLVHGKRFCKSRCVKLHQWNSSIEEPLHSSTVEKSERPEQNRDLRCQSGPSAKDSVLFSGGDSSKNYGADQQRLQISDLHFDKFPTPATFACWKIRFKTEVCTCSQIFTEAMQWIKEVELVASVDELRSSSSIRGISMPNFEVLDARIASALNKIIHNSHIKRRVSLEERKAQKEDRFLRGS